MAADAADAALEAPRASIISAPRFWTLGMKFLSIPCLIYDLPGGLIIYRTLTDVRILCRRMIAPNNHFFNIRHMRARMSGELRKRPIVIQSSHSGELLWIDFRCVALCDERIRICWITNDQYFDIA